MPKYVKNPEKPEVVEAIKWTGENFEELVYFLMRNFAHHGATTANYDYSDMSLVLKMKVLEEGEVVIARLRAGDYLIKRGVLQVNSPDVFEKTYTLIQ